jgi:hypothetical protein
MSRETKGESFRLHDAKARVHRTKAVEPVDKSESTI